jgi:glycosyltransferase involved in cell wall biosynthesis
MTIIRHPTGHTSLRGTAPCPEGPIRVLFVNDHLGYPGGVVHGSTTYLTNTLPAFDPGRVQASLAIFRPHHPAANRLRELGVDVRFFSRPKWDLRPVWDLARLLRRRPVDILHVNGQKAHLLGRMAGILSGIPVIIHLHFHYRPRPRWLNVRLARRTAMALAVSDFLREHSVGEFGMPPERARTIYNAIDVDRFVKPAPDARPRIRQELGISDRQTMVTVCGRLTTLPDKGQMTAIRAIALLIRNHPHAVLVLVGDGPAKGQCESLIAQLGLSHAVRMTGQRSDISEILAATDIFLMPSSAQEAFGYSAAEAMCANRPVVASRVGGLVEMLANGERGLLVEPNDATGMASAVASLMENPDLAARLAAAGHAFASTLTIARHVGQLTELYEQVLSAAGTERVTARKATP